VKLPALDAAATVADTAARIRTLLAGKDRVGDFLRRTLGATIEYAARVSTEIAHSADDIDRAMRLGFGWELGPFEISDEDRAGARARPPAKSMVKGNAGASLIDTGDGILCVEFHSKLNTLGGDAISMIQAGVTEAAANYRALVIANDADNFSAGANLMLILLEAQEGNWDEIDAMVRAFQAATMALKTSPVPVVAAPAGLTLGGGCEVCLHAGHVRAAAETYTGLVEVGVGLLPAGGGTKEMLIRSIDRAGSADPFPYIQHAFETIGFGKASTSALDARRLGYLRDSDSITMNRDRLFEDAKRDAIALAAAGYQPLTARANVPVGGPDTYATLALGIHLAHRAGRITDHETIIARKIARVLSGGDVPHKTTITEQALLDLEREGFLSLCGEQKTLERMAHMLKTGKVLRN
jgi:3-hydroxyacyl-CoA dehydrogenase